MFFVPLSLLHVWAFKTINPETPITKRRLACVAKLWVACSQAAQMRGSQMPQDALHMQRTCRDHPNGNGPIGLRKSWPPKTPGTPTNSKSLESDSKVAFEVSPNIRCFWPHLPCEIAETNFVAISMVFLQILVDFLSISIDLLSFSISFNQSQSILISFNQFDSVKNAGIY